MTTGIRLTADDYGIAPGVSAAIRELLDAGRLTGTSAMTGMPAFRDEGPRLRALADRVQLGVHLTLTDHAPLGAMPDLAPLGRFPTVRELTRRAVLGRLDVDEIEAELQRQVDAFVAAVGRPPDYLDGHHHVHQLPIVREAALRVHRARVVAHGGWMRTTAEARWTIVRRRESVPKSLGLAWVGGALDASLRRAGLATNEGFAGAYDLTTRVPYAARFARFLVGVREGAAVLTHPGLVDDVLRAADTLTDAREVELRFLSGPAFLEVLSLARVHVRTGRESSAATQGQDRLGGRDGA